MLQFLLMLCYYWCLGVDGIVQFGEILIDGQLLNCICDYCVIVNNFLFEGGDVQVGFKYGCDWVVFGIDIDVFVEWLCSNFQVIEQIVFG